MNADDHGDELSREAQYFAQFYWGRAHGPSVLLRRRTTEQGGEIAEAFDRKGRWDRTNFFDGYRRSDDDYAEVSYEEAKRIVKEFRADYAERNPTVLAREARYFATLGAGFSRERPSGLLRKRPTEKYGNVPEAFTRNDRWEHTDFFVREKYGDNDTEYVEVAYDEAEKILAQFGATLAESAAKKLATE